MQDTDTLVLNKTEVALKIQRIAWEIFEKHVNEKQLHIVGISKSGYWLAEKIMQRLAEISDLKLSLIEMEINKKSPLSKDVKLSKPLAELKGQSVVLVDDVLNSGSVLMHGARHLLSEDLKQLTSAVLIDRNHKRYPIKADVKGLSLSTTMQEHVNVEIEDDNAVVYLN